MRSRYGGGRPRCIRTPSEGEGGEQSRRTTGLQHMNSSNNYHMHHTHRGGGGWISSASCSRSDSTPGFASSSPFGTSGAAASPSSSYKWYLPAKSPSEALRSSSAFLFARIRASSRGCGRGEGHAGVGGGGRVASMQLRYLWTVTQAVIWLPTVVATSLVLGRRSWCCWQRCLLWCRLLKCCVWQACGLLDASLVRDVSQLPARIWQRRVDSSVIQHCMPCFYD